MNENPRPTTIAQWIDRLNSEEMPIFSHTVSRISRLAETDNSSAAELAQVILQDTTMTARVLRVANSVIYNPFGYQVKTISRAVVILGFNTIRSITLTITLIDSILKNSCEERVNLELARSFHAALQARKLTERSSKIDPEEIFIAAFLLHLGPLVFWCFPYGYDVPLLEELSFNPEDESLAERRVLGFTLSQLTIALNREWHLSNLIESNLKGPDGNNPQSRIMKLAWKVAIGSEHGWDSDELAGLLKDSARLLEISGPSARSFLEDNAVLARQGVSDCGAYAIASLIPLPKRHQNADTEPQRSTDTSPDYHLQISILRELSAMMNRRIDINAMITMVLEGISRGLAMDRAWFALVPPGSKLLVIKYALGTHGQQMKGKELVSAESTTNNIFLRVLSVTRKPVWHRASQPLGELPQEISRWIGEHDFLLMPLIIDNQPRGVFFADRLRNEEPVTEEHFLGFQHFCEQALIGLNMYQHQNGP